LSSAANLPDEATEKMTVVAKTGVYYGYAQVIPPAEKTGEFEPGELVVLPMVMSLGWNPFYDNKKMTAVSRNVCFRQAQILIRYRKSTSCMASREISMALKCVLSFLDISGQS
jgi:hypothetical protein